MTLDADQRKSIKHLEAVLKDLLQEDTVKLNKRSVLPVREQHLHIQFQDQLDPDSVKGYSVLKNVLLNMDIPFDENSEKIPEILLLQNYLIIRASTLPNSILHDDFQKEFTKLYQQFSEEYDKASIQSEDENEQTYKEELDVCDFAIKELISYHMTASVRGADLLEQRQKQLNALIHDITNIKNSYPLESDRKAQLIAYLHLPEAKSTMLRVARNNILHVLDLKPLEPPPPPTPVVTSSQIAPGDDSDSSEEPESDFPKGEPELDISVDVDILKGQEAHIRDEFKEAEKSNNKRQQHILQKVHDKIRDDFSMFLEEYNLPPTQFNLEFARIVIRPLSIRPDYLIKRKAFLENELLTRKFFPQQKIGIATELKYVTNIIQEQSRQVRHQMVNQYKNKSSAPAKEDDIPYKKSIGPDEEYVIPYKKKPRAPVKEYVIPYENKLRAPVKEYAIPPELLTGEITQYEARPGKLYLEFDNSLDFSNFKKVAKQEGFLEEGTSASIKKGTADYRVASPAFTIEMYKPLQDFVFETRGTQPEKNRPRNK